MKFLSNGIFYFAVSEEEPMQNAPGKMLKCRFAIYKNEKSVDFSFGDYSFLYVPYTIYGDLEEITEEDFKAHIKKYAPIVWRKLKLRNGDNTFCLSTNEMSYRDAYCHYFMDGKESCQDFWDSLTTNKEDLLEEAIGIFKDLLTTKVSKEEWTYEMHSTINAWIEEAVDELPKN